MYIAFKWLFCLVLGMWITACCIDIYFKRNRSILNPDVGNDLVHVAHGYKNILDLLKNYQCILFNGKYNYLEIISDYTGLPLLYYLSLSLGIFMIFVINSNKSNVLVYMKNKMTKAKDQPYISQSIKKIKYLKDHNILLIPLVCLVKVLQFLIKFKIYLLKLLDDLCLSQFTKLNELGSYYAKENKLLVTKLKQIQRERKKLKEVLYNVVNENKNVQSQFQLQKVITAELRDSIQVTQKLFKGQLSKYNSLQHLCIVTDRENKCIKSKFHKLSIEKNDIEKKLMNLVRQVFLSKNAELKAFCSRWIVKPENSLLFMNVTKEIERFISGSTINTCSRTMIQHGDYKFRLNPVREIAEKSIDELQLTSNKGSPVCDWNEKDRTLTLQRSYSDYNYCDMSDGKYCLEYSTVFGKLYQLPRQQVAFGDPGLSYTFSGITVPALPWPYPVAELRELLFKLKGINYNFVLVNKYRNGSDHIGEHRDNERDLDLTCPIASISLGQERPFVFKHRDARNSGTNKRSIPQVKINLEHGSILFMNPPTNELWYHSLPARKKLTGVRINLTFRKIRRTD